MRQSKHCHSYFFHVSLAHLATALLRLCLSGRLRMCARLLQLQGLHSSMGSAALNINQCRAVMRLLQAMCESTDAASVWEVQRAAQQGQLYVPSLESRLVPARDCVCVSAASNRLLHR